MTPSELEYLLDMAMAAFPNSQGKNMAPTFDVWSLFLAHLPLDIALIALGKYVVSGAEFLPAPGKLLSYADETMNPARRTPADAWAEVMYQVRYTGYTGTPVWSSPAIAKAVEGLGGFQNICASAGTMADRAHFLKMYEIEARREKEQSLLPPAIRQLIAPPGANVRILETGKPDLLGNP